MTLEGPGYFGKLPGSGDFVSRGLSRGLITSLDTWLHDGLASLPGALGPDWLEYYLVAPAWSFVLPAGVWGPNMLLGSAIPSVDRVGRYFPLVALTGVTDGVSLNDCLPPQSDWFDAARAALLSALQESSTPDALFESLPRMAPKQRAADAMVSADGDIFSILGDSAGEDAGDQGFSWPEMPLLFDARDNRSYWWSEPSPAQPARHVIHRGTPDSDLFARLFGAAQD